MAFTNPYQQYRDSSVLTASKGKLLLMTYDGTMRFVGQAKVHMAAKAYEDQNICITKAQRLLLELIYTLDRKADPDLAQRLAQLYEYMFNRLVEANVDDNAAALDEVLRHLGELRSAWAEADRELTTSAVAATQTGAGGARYAVAA
jgi:flagellar secretion chaperone FliS